MDYVEKKPVTIAITGASGSRYALGLLQELLRIDVPVYLLLSSASITVMDMEAQLTLPTKGDNLEALQKEALLRHLGLNNAPLTVFSSQDWFSPIASGTAQNGPMVVCPCSMGMLSAIAVGASNNLMERGVDVCLKEKRKLIVVPREAPFSTIHLENMLKLSQLGALILPANPGFYQGADSIEDVFNFIVARIMQHLNYPYEHLLKPWGSK
jgi:flavin prenyltransferase